jgi:hypothetical protein
MDYKIIILKIKLQKSTELSTIQLDEMAAFYLMLLKYKKKRASFDVALVMEEVYTENIFEKFMLNFSKTD